MHLYDLISHNDFTWNSCCSSNDRSPRNKLIVGPILVVIVIVVHLEGTTGAEAVVISVCSSKVPDIAKSITILLPKGG